MDPILDIARRYGLKVVEDAAQAHGARYRARDAGGLGDVACFSFYPGKNLGAYGDAGAVVTNDPEIARKVRLLRDHGRLNKYEHLEIGYGERLDSLQAAILRVKLTHLEDWIQARSAIAHAYSKLLDQDSVITPYELPDARHVYHLYVIRTARRNELLNHLKQQGIGAGVHYPIPLHQQPAYLKHSFSAQSLPVSEQAAREVLSLPIFPELSESCVAQVVGVIKEIVKPKEV
jgi:dTDP-4-amino-4,6-dideoxygalactose transaminase